MLKSFFRRKDTREILCVVRKLMTVMCICIKTAVRGGFLEKNFDCSSFET